MFGLSFSGQLIQGPAERTWNCISHIANFVWYKFTNNRQPVIMPKPPRRKHHSRSRSRSHSHERDVKRRKIEQYNSPNHKRSVSPPIDPTHQQPRHDDPSITSSIDDEITNSPLLVLSDSEHEDSMMGTSQEETAAKEEEKVESSDNGKEEASKPTTSNGNEVICLSDDGDDKLMTSQEATEAKEEENVESKDNEKEEAHEPTTSNRKEVICLSDEEDDKLMTSDAEIEKYTSTNTTPIAKTPTSKTIETTPPVSNIVKRITSDKTPSKRMTPKQLEKKLESEKKRQLREKEKEERERQRQLEKEQKEAEKLKMKELKQKEIEMKQKEKEEKEEQKRQEKELKLKQKEEERLRKLQEMEEKMKEKLKEEEKKQKAVAAFVSFFVPKKGSDVEEKKVENVSSIFLPFELKCDMKLPPCRRQPLTYDEKTNLENLIQNNKSEYSYLKDLKSTKVKSCQRTWPYRDNDDVVVIEDEVLPGESICELKPKTALMKVKLLQFHENQRPAYYGTWRKKSKNVTGRKPMGKEEIFDYEVDSDDDWEEEEQGENLEVASDEEKENEPDNDDYQVDNEFFVPHGHLSDDEVDDEEISKLSPESQKQKLKLLKDAFDSDIKSKTKKIKPRSIGCIWYKKDGSNVDEAIDHCLKPLNVITIGIIEIKKRALSTGNDSKKKRTLQKPLPDNILMALAKIVQGNTNKREKLIDEFLDYIKTNNADLELSKRIVSKQISMMAKWTKNVDCNGYSWNLNGEFAEKFHIDLPLTNNPNNSERK